MKKTAITFFFTALLAGCVAYTSPPRNTWRTYLRGASMSDMTDAARVAKRPVYLGAGGRLVGSVVAVPVGGEYGDKIANDNAAAVQYMANLEFALYDALRKPGISVQRAGTDVVVILVRDAIMELDVAEISDTGADTVEGTDFGRNAKPFVDPLL